MKFPLLVRGLAIVLSAFVAACDSPMMDLGEQATLYAAIDERRQPIEPRERFSFEDERIYLSLTIPPETAGPEQRDFHLEILDGEGAIVSANGALLTRARPDWRVLFPYQINREIDAPGLWTAHFYVDGRHLESMRFPVTVTPDAPLPESDRPAIPANCCRTPGPTTFQAFFAEGVNEETRRLTGRRESFSFSDGKMYLYVRIPNIALTAHELRYVFFDGAGKQVWSYENAFTPTGRSWVAWVYRDFSRGSDAAGLWTVDIYLDGALLGSVTVPVEA